MNSQSALDAALLRRVYGEFLEMPGLRLTCRQAQRLWGLDEGTCLRLLESLVDARFLCRLSHGTYTRLTDGHAHPRLRTVTAQIADDLLRPKKESTSGKTKSVGVKVS